MSWLFVLVLLVMSAGVAFWLFRPPPESRMNDDAIARESMIELFRSELEELDVEHQRGLLTDSQYAGLKRCLLYTSPSPRDGATSRMPSSA